MRPKQFLQSRLGPAMDSRRMMYLCSCTVACLVLFSLTHFLVAHERPLRGHRFDPHKAPRPAADTHVGQRQVEFKDLTPQAVQEIVVRLKDQLHVALPPKQQSLPSHQKESVGSPQHGKRTSIAIDGAGGDVLHTPPPRRRHHRSKRRQFKPVAPDMSDNVFPGKLHPQLLCVTPNMSATTWFRNHTGPVQRCDGSDGYYEFSKRSGAYVHITNCDGRVYYTLSDGLQSSEEQRAASDTIYVGSAEMVMVTCQTADGTSAHNLHPRINHQPRVYERAQRLGRAFSHYRIKQQQLHNDYIKTIQAKDMSGGVSNEPLSVVLLLVDSLSRANFLRSLPRTHQFFKNVHKETRGGYQSFDFQLYNIVGSGTYENAPPILTGTPYNDDWNVDTMYELPTVQRNDTLRKLRNKKANTHPSLWDIWHHHGAATCFVEEACIRNTGAVARVWRHKVKKDLSIQEHRSFKRTAGRLMDHSFFNIWCDVMEKMGIGDFFSKSTRPKLCFGGKHMHEWSFEYIEEFFANYPDVSRFALAMMAEAHEASALRIRGVDDHLASFLRRMTLEHPNTAIMVFGDHGLGYGDFSKTEAARLEYKLPAAFLLVPSGVLAPFPQLAKNLRTNQRRFVTGFDLYHTLVHLREPENPRHYERYKVSRMNSKARKAYAKKHETKLPLLGASLLFPVSLNRTCKDMDIPMEYCACTNYHTVDDADSDQYRLLADLTIHHLNTRAHAYPPTSSPCVIIELDQVTRVQIATTADEADKQLVITFKTKGDEDNHITSEVFESVLYQKNISKFNKMFDKHGKSRRNRLKSMEIGLGWKTDKKIFEGPTGVLPRDAGTVWAIERWHTTEHDDEVDFDVLWIEPKAHDAPENAPENIHKTTDVEIAKSWVMAWQPLVHDTPLREGEWTVRIVQRQTKKVLAVSHFYIMGERYPGIPIVMLDRYWKVKHMKRLTAYEKHRGCAGPDEPLEYCVCDKSTKYVSGESRQRAAKKKKKTITKKKKETSAKASDDEEEEDERRSVSVRLSEER